MNATMTEVVEACARAAGKPLQWRGSRARCPFCGRDGKFHISDEKKCWSCIRTECERGLYFDAPIAFGLAFDRREARVWLEDRGLIESSHRNSTRPAETLPREYVDPKLLSERQRDVWRQAQLDLRDATLWESYLAFREKSAERRHPRWEAQRKKDADNKAALIEALKRGIACQRARDRARRQNAQWCPSGCPCFDYKQNSF